MPLPNSKLGSQLAQPGISQNVFRDLRGSAFRSKFRENWGLVQGPREIKTHAIFLRKLGSSEVMRKPIRANLHIYIEISRHLGQHGLRNRHSMRNWSEILQNLGSNKPASPGLDASTSRLDAGLDASMPKLDASMLFRLSLCSVASRMKPRRTSTRLDAPRRASTHHLDVPRRTSTHLDTLDGLRRFLIRLSVLDMLQYTIKP